MWVRVLPADDTKPTYLKELSDEDYPAEMQSIVGGHWEIVKSMRLAEKYGFNKDTNRPNVVMVVNGDANLLHLPANSRASKFYPNDYNLAIKGDVLFVGEGMVVDPEDGPGIDFVDYPRAWRAVLQLDQLSDDLRPSAHGRAVRILKEFAPEEVQKAYDELHEKWGWTT